MIFFDKVERILAVGTSLVVGVASWLFLTVCASADRPATRKARPASPPPRETTLDAQVKPDAHQAQSDARQAQPDTQVDVGPRRRTIQRRQPLPRNYVE